MVPLTRIIDTIAGTIDEWSRVSWQDLHLAEGPTAILVLTVLAATAALVIAARHYWSRKTARWHRTSGSSSPRTRVQDLSPLMHGRCRGGGFRGQYETSEIPKACLPARIRMMDEWSGLPV